MLWVVLAIAGSIAAGWHAERRAGARASAFARRLLKTLLFVVTPPVAFLNIVHLEIAPDVGGGILVGWAALVLSGLAAWAIAWTTALAVTGYTALALVA